MAETIISTNSSVEIVLPFFSSSCIAAPCMARADGCERKVNILLQIIDFIQKW